MLKRLTRIASQFAKVIFAVVISVFLSSPSIVLTKTQAGIHCPTASVQKIADNDGSVRTPKLGDVDFKQCDCAEKEVAKEKSELERIALSTIIPALNVEHLVCPIFPFNNFPIQIIETRLQNRLDSRTIAPSVPPPNSI